MSTGDEIGRRWLAGDEDGLRVAYEHWSAAVYTYCTRRLGPHDGADATQEVFVVAWRRRAAFDPERGSLPQWLFGIARNVCADQSRLRQRAPVPIEPSGGDGPAPGSEDRLADRLLVHGALRRLPERQQRVIRASFIDGLTNRAVADQLGIPLGTVKSNIRRGLRTLRDEMGTGHG